MTHAGRYLQADAQAGLRQLRREGVSARCVYMDPPYTTGRDFGAYDDRLHREALLARLRNVLEHCLELLTADGSLFVHVDHRLSAHVRLLLDDVMGERHFRNEIIWAYESGGRAVRHFSRKHDTILYYARGTKPYFDGQAVALPRTQVRRNHMRRGVDEAGRAYAAITTGGKEYRYYDDEGVPPGDVWTDISHLQQRDPERTGYPTQKPLALMERILLATTEVGDTVIDPFCGSGTLLHAAVLHGRVGIGIDSSPESLRTVRKRLSQYPIDYT